MCDRLLSKRHATPKSAWNSWDSHPDPGRRSADGTLQLSQWVSQPSGLEGGHVWCPVVGAEGVGHSAGTAVSHWSRWRPPSVAA